MLYVIFKKIISYFQAARLRHENKDKIVGFQVKQAAIMSMKCTSEGKIRVRAASVKLETGAKQGKERLLKPPQSYLPHEATRSWTEGFVLQPGNFLDRSQPEP